MSVPVHNLRIIAALLSTILLAGGAQSFQAIPGQKPDPALELIAGVYAPALSAIPSKLRIVSFNVHLGQDLEAIIATLSEDEHLIGADILLIQEIEMFPEEDVIRAAQLAERLKMDFVYAPARVQVRAGKTGTHGLAVLSRYPIQDVVILPLPEYKVRFGKRRRVAVGVTVMVPGGGVRIYNLHLDTRISLKQRRQQIAPVLRDARQQEAMPVVIGGDFNTNPFRWAGGVVPLFRSDQAGGMDRHMKRAGYENPLAEAGGTVNRRGLTMRLDSFYVRGAQVEGAGVDREVSSSDHFPIWVELRWPPAAGQ